MTRAADSPLRAEVPLSRAETVVLDGAPLRVHASAGPLMRLGIDPLATPVRPVAFTGGGNEKWVGPWVPLAGRPPNLADSILRARLDQVRDNADSPKGTSSQKSGLAVTALPADDQSTIPGLPNEHQRR